MEVMEDSSHLLGDQSRLLDRLNRQGYLYLKGLLDREVVLSARRKVLDHLAEKDNLSDGKKITRIVALVCPQ